MFYLNIRFTNIRIPMAIKMNTNNDISLPTNISMVLVCQILSAQMFHYMLDPDCSHQTTKT